LIAPLNAWGHKRQEVHTTTVPIPELIDTAHRDLESLSRAPAGNFVAARNRRFRRLLEHHVRNGRNKAYGDLWRGHGLDPQRDVPLDLAAVERLGVRAGVRLS
jgi:hypothetical protein